ncbi:hypothetical protein CVU75_01360 [Candidatus Dependentiae bacterium HGW-Dependentiae-1]|nr:MAG: hypothetical protein CVU75_01360 [Candidatus Dependentiae bacterium HGW-Dependentiae-1]
MKKLIVLALGLIISSGIILAKAPKEIANIVRVKNQCKQHEASVTAYYQKSAASKPRHIRAKALRGKEVDFVYTSHALGGTIQRIRIIYPHDKAPLIIKNLEAGKEYLVNFGDENWTMRNIK